MFVKPTRLFGVLLAILCMGTMPLVHGSQVKSYSSSSLSSSCASSSSATSVATTSTSEKTEKDIAMQKRSEDYQKKAKAGDLFALGKCYEKGYGVQQDLAVAAKYYQDAARKDGDEQAFYYLPIFYKKNTTIADHLKLYVYWLERVALGKVSDTAADADFFPDARYLYRLALCYKKGCGVEQDLKKACMYYHAAAQAGESRACYQLGRCYDLGSGVVASPQKAFAYYKKAADRWFEKAFFTVGYCYESGYGVAKNYGEALKYYNFAIKAGQRDAYCQIGNLYRDGHDTVVRNLKEAFRYYFHTACDDMQSLAAICYLYEQGINLSKQDEYFKAYYDAAMKIRNSLSAEDKQKVSNLVMDFWKERIVKQGDVLDCTDLECAVCKAGYVHNDELAVLACGHRFHMACIGEWFNTLAYNAVREQQEQRAPCPECRHNCLIGRQFCARQCKAL